MTWLRQLLDWQREAADPAEFLDALRFDLSSQEVYVFTPKGDVIALPTGSTPVDFAYAVHTEVGHKCIGARVNGKLVPLESTLVQRRRDRDLHVEGARRGPTQDWLGFVKSPRARTKIRQYFNKERREEAIEHGKDAIVKAMRKQGMPLQRMLTLETADRDRESAPGRRRLAVRGGRREPRLRPVGGAALIATYGGEEGAAEDIAEGRGCRPRRERRKRTARGDPGVVVKGRQRRLVKLARCCTPVPGDAIFGFVTRSGGVSVHRDGLRQRRGPADPAASGWSRSSGSPTAASMFLVAIQVEALDRHKLLGRRHPGALRRAGQHPVRRRSPPPGTGWR